ncbi:hypothetical protein GDO78_005765 [Eleutherodactylus coqui]|uniref:Uncharacterized protein n=1 Tax=Eleutherodactylus coqui TaxID=57060 RepID=A0A8J6KF72_ELECQ|nr:hypothetical protein GDO78_005765 [Eleutherodactylus coqui]
MIQSFIQDCFCKTIGTGYIRPSAHMYCFLICILLFFTSKRYSLSFLYDSQLPLPCTCLSITCSSVSQMCSVLWRVIAYDKHTVKHAVNTKVKSLPPGPLIYLSSLKATSYESRLTISEYHTIRKLLKVCAVVSVT